MGIGDEYDLSSSLKKKEDKKDKEENTINEKDKKNKKGNKVFMFGIRDDKIQKLKDFDKKYTEKVLDIF